jgi:hypothetical protein
MHTLARTKTNKNQSYFLFCSIKLTQLNKNLASNQQNLIFQTNSDKLFSKKNKYNNYQTNKHRYFFFCFIRKSQYNYI